MRRDEVRAIALDFDGVIADSMPSQERAWRLAVDEVMPSAGKSLWRALCGNLYAGKAGPQMFQGVELSEEEKRRLRRSKDVHWERLRSAVKLMPGAAEGLRRLATYLRLAIATTAPRDYVEGLLDRENLTGCFQQILTNRDVPNPKPAPDLLLEASRAMKVPIRALLMVGDTQADLEMASAAGCPFVLFGPEAPYGPSSAVEKVRIVGSWEELYELVTRHFRLLVRADPRLRCAGFLAQAALLVTRDLAAELASFHPVWKRAWQRADRPENLIDTICLQTPIEEAAAALADAFNQFVERGEFESASKVFELIHCALPAAYLSGSSASFPDHSAAAMKVKAFTNFLAAIASAGVEGKPIALTTPADMERETPRPVYKLPNLPEPGVDPKGRQRALDVSRELAIDLGVMLGESSPDADLRALRYIAQIALRKPGGDRTTLLSPSQLTALDRFESGSPEERAGAILIAVNRRLSEEARQNRRFYLIADPGKPDTVAFLQQLRDRLPELRHVNLQGSPTQFATEDSVANSLQKA